MSDELTPNLNELLLSAIIRDPKKASGVINATGQYTTIINKQENAKSTYNDLYSQIENSCQSTGTLSKENKEVITIEKFFQQDKNHILFLVSSLAGESAICALELYNLHFQNERSKLLDYPDIENSDVLRKVYVENGADITSFALATAVHFYQVPFSDLGCS